MLIIVLVILLLLTAGYYGSADYSEELEKLMDQENNIRNSIVPNYEPGPFLDNNIIGLPVRGLQKGEFIPIVYWPTRRMLLGEVEFLTYVRERYPSIKTITYCANGKLRNIEPLAVLFPQYKFDIYTDIDQKYNGVNQYTGEPQSADALILFYIFDGLFKLSNEHNNMAVAIEKMLEYQKQLVLKLRPKISFIIFQVPSMVEKYGYFRGDIHIAPWLNQRARQLRMIVDSKDNFEMAVYNPTDYNQKIHSWNLIYRTHWYPHNITGVRGLDHCWDCVREIGIWERYRKLFGIKKDISDLINYTSELLKDTNTDGLLQMGHGLLVDEKDYKKRIDGIRLIEPKIAEITEGATTYLKYGKKANITDIVNSIKKAH